MNIRPATLRDLEAITAIYNHAIVHTTATFDTAPKTAEDQLRWFGAHASPRSPVIVVESGGEVLGWGSLSPWSDRCAYADTGEDSVYVREDQRGRGIGKAILAELIEAGRRAELHTLVARIADDNPASIKLHAALGFQTLGIMREVGFKFGRRIDVHLMQLML